MLRSISRLRPRLSSANVVSVVALFVALGTGGAYAASKIGPKDIKKNAVRAKHVKKNQIRAKHIKRNQVRPKHIRDGAVTEAILADGVGGLRGPAGPQGPAGAKGDRGPQGAPGVSEHEIIVGDVGLPDDDGGAQAEATCPTGKVVMGGGAQIFRAGPGVPDVISMVFSFPNPDRQNQWLAGALENGTVGDWQLVPYAICSRAEG